MSQKDWFDRWLDSSWGSVGLFGIPALIQIPLWLTVASGEVILWGTIAVGVVSGFLVWLTAVLGNDSNFAGKLMNVFMVPLAFCFVGIFISGWLLILDDYGAKARESFQPVASSTPSPSPETITPTPKPCLIKGNISFNTGEKIYHVPGSDYYKETVIEKNKGERYFCTQAQAKKAGFRKAKPAPPPEPSRQYYDDGSDPYAACGDFETREEAGNAGYDCEDLPNEEELDEYGNEY